MGGFKRKSLFLLNFNFFNNTKLKKTLRGVFMVTLKTLNILITLTSLSTLPALPMTRVS